MNELTDPGRRCDGRVTCGMKGLAYDVVPYLAAWDPAAVITDADLHMLLEAAA